MAKRKDDLGIAMCVGGVFRNLQNRVVFQEAIQHIKCFAGRARNNLSAVDCVLVRNMGIDADGFPVIAIITWIVRSQEGAGAHAKSLRIRGGDVAGAMYGA